jgi:hypothetical protein
MRLSIVTFSDRGADCSSAISADLGALLALDASWRVQNGPFCNEDRSGQDGGFTDRAQTSADLHRN